MADVKMKFACAQVMAVSTIFFTTQNASSEEHVHATNAPDVVSPATNSASHKMKTQLGSSAGFDAAGVLWAVSSDGETAGGHLVLQHSRDGGKTWSLKSTISAESVVASGDERPRINFGTKGEVYVTYSRPLSKPYTSEVRFIHSEDGGRSFSKPVTVHKDAKIITHGFASTIVDAKGVIYVSWIDKRDQQEAKNGGEDYAGAAQYYAVSLDGGRTFDGDYKIADHSCECCRSAMALNSEGQAVLLWRHVFEPNIRDHATVRLNATGKLEQIERASFDNWAIDACPHQGPALAFGPDGRRHQTWFTGGANGGALYYASQGRDGQLGMPMRLGNELATNADVAVDEEHVEIVWKEFDGEVTHIRGNSSWDAGATWQSHSLASTKGSSDQPRLVKSGQQIYLFWRTEIDGIKTLSLSGGKP